jgi:hypothetical protein
MFKKFLGPSALLCVPLLPLPAQADGFTSTIQDSIGISVQGAAVQTTRMGSSYSVSGVNVEAATATTAIGLSAATAGATSLDAITPNPTAFNIVNEGQEFSLSEKLFVGDSVINPSTANSGVINPVTYSTITTQAAGFAGTGATVGSSPTAKIDTKLQTLEIVGGGVGTTVTAGRTVSLTAF